MSNTDKNAQINCLTGISEESEFLASMVAKLPKTIDMDDELQQLSDLMVRIYQRLDKEAH